MCNFDCLNCPYPDCISDKPTRAEYWKMKYEERRQDPEYREKCREWSRAWRARNKEHVAAMHKEWLAKEGNRERDKKNKQEWFQKNKDRIYAAQKEKRRLEREGDQ